MKICMACGMPLNNSDDIGIENETGLFCKHCINEDKSVKGCQEIFDGGGQFFMEAVPNTDKELSERITRKNMNALAYWQGKDPSTNAQDECLKGDQASDEEFQVVLTKLASK